MAAKLVSAGDLVYCDPPYAPISKTSYFTDYSKDGFGLDSHEALAKTFMTLAQTGAHVMLTNSITPLTEILFKDFYVSKVLARRNVNSRTDKRGEIAEVLVTTFPIDGAQRGHVWVEGSVCKATATRLPLISQWLIKHQYQDVADLIDEVVSEWRKAGKQTRRNWWEVLAGTPRGKTRTIAGRVFPVLRAAQERQGLPVTANAICRDEQETPPPIRITGRWAK